MRAVLAIWLSLLFVVLPFRSLAEDGRASVTFMGFLRLEDGTSRLFVHVSHKPSLLVEEEDKTIVFKLANATILVRNNKNPLDLRHFDTPVKQARLVPAGDDVALVVELKTKVDVRHRFVENADGSVSLQVDFPSRSADKKGSRTAVSDGLLCEP